MKQTLTQEDKDHQQILGCPSRAAFPPHRQDSLHFGHRTRAVARLCSRTAAAYHRAREYEAPGNEVVVGQHHRMGRHRGDFQLKNAKKAEDVVDST